MATDKAWNDSYIPPFSFAIEAGALTPARIRFGLEELAWFTEEALAEHLLQRWTDGVRDDVWESLALLLAPERDEFRPRLRALAPEDGDAPDFWLLTALSWLAAHRQHEHAWVRLTELWYDSGTDPRITWFAAEWDEARVREQRPVAARTLEVQQWDRTLDRLRDGVARSRPGGFGDAYRPDDEDPTRDLDASLPIAFVFELGGMTPERVLYGLLRHWIDEAELVATLAPGWWADPVWGSVAMVLADELETVAASLSPFASDRVEEAERFWRYAMVGWLFRQSREPATRLLLEEIWCGFGHPPDFPFAPSFERPKQSWRRLGARRTEQTFEGMWSAYLVEEQQRLGVPVVDWTA